MTIRKCAVAALISVGLAACGGSDSSERNTLDNNVAPNVKNDFQPENIGLFPAEVDELDVQSDDLEGLWLVKTVHHLLLQTEDEQAQANVKLANSVVMQVKKTGENKYQIAECAGEGRKATTLNVSGQEFTIALVKGNIDGNTRLTWDSIPIDLSVVPITLTYGLQVATHESEGEAVKVSNDYTAPLGSLSAVDETKNVYCVEQDWLTISTNGLEFDGDAEVSQLTLESANEESVLFEWSNVYDGEDVTSNNSLSLTGLGSNNWGNIGEEFPVNSKVMLTMDASGIVYNQFGNFEVSTQINLVR